MEDVFSSLSFPFKVSSYPIVPLAPERIVDTNGAGDAYVGGFLAALFRGQDTERWEDMALFHRIFILGEILVFD